MLPSTDGSRVVIDLMRDWARAVETHDIDFIKNLMTDDFVFSCSPFIGEGHSQLMGKDRFIELDRTILNSSIDFIDINAEEIGDIVFVRTVAKVSESFKGDIGADMPSIEELNELMSNITLVYASGWRKINNNWYCFDHHIVGATQSRTSVVVK